MNFLLIAAALGLGLVLITTRQGREQQKGVAWGGTQLERDIEGFLDPRFVSPGVSGSRIWIPAWEGEQQINP